MIHHSMHSSVLHVISSHRGSLSPDDIDSLLAVKAASLVSRKTSGEETTAGGSGRLHDTTTDDLKLLTVSSSVPQMRLSEEGGGGGMEKTRDNSSMLARRSSHTFAAAATLRGGGRGHSHDGTTIEDVETTDSGSFQVQTTLVSSGDHDGKAANDDQGRGDIHVSELRDTDSGSSSQGSPIDNVGVSSSAHVHHQQQATPPGPGPLHMAAKYAPKLIIIM
jgi:hypothetical protein